jgi:SAM-dependent methyltransferase
LAIDPEAPTGPIFRQACIEELGATDEFDAVVASRSLHHVTDLGIALDKVAGVLGGRGVLVIDDFGWELLDADSADRVGIPFAEWRDEHEHLHTSQAMLTELDKRFGRRSFSWEPYLHREGHQAVTEEVERQLIEDDELPALGFRYVGNR